MRQILKIETTVDRELCQVLKRFTITLLCAASLTGCASFISGGTGTAPVGTNSGERSLGQIFIDSSFKSAANINF